MPQAETTQIKVQIEAGELRYEASGSPDEIIPQVLQFLSQTMPTYDLARRLLYVADLASLTDKVAEFAKMSGTGQFLLTRTDLPSDRAILVVLFMAYLTAKLGKRPADTLTLEELANSLSRAVKTIRNVAVDLQKSGLIDRPDRGLYRITPKGLMELELCLTSGNRNAGAD